MEALLVTLAVVAGFLAVAGVLAWRLWRFMVLLDRFGRMSEAEEQEP